MRLVVLMPKSASDLSRAHAWAYYGAVSALQMLGVSFSVVSEVPDERCLVIDPDADAIQSADAALVSRVEIAAVDLTAVTHEMTPQPDDARLLTGCPECLPLFGPPHELTGTGIGSARTLAGDVVGPFLKVRGDAVGLSVRFGGRLFATIGMYLSRFSWPDNPGFEGFVRRVDRLWDDHLRDRYGAIPVVDEYLSLLANVLVWCHAQARHPFATVWQHPYRDGTVMRHGLVLTHDTDVVYEQPSYRSPGRDQTGNRWFNFQRWRQFETSLGVKSAFFVISPHPSEVYWMNPSYAIDDPPVLHAVGQIARHGWEVSIQQLTYDGPREASQEAVHFKMVTGMGATGTRSHSLKHHAHLLTYKRGAGLTYDSTWYAEQARPGFLCGTTLPFAPLDTITGMPLDLWEFAAVVEDGVVFGLYADGEIGRDTAGAVAQGTVAIDQILAHNGYVCLNWRQECFARMDTREGLPANWTPALEQLIRYVQSRSAAWWNPLPSELAQWWSRRALIRIRPTPDGIEVHNAGREPIEDAVICLHNSQASGSISLGHSGSRSLHAVPLALAAGETKHIRTE